jgi:hypothetical protein
MIIDAGLHQDWSREALSPFVFVLLFWREQTLFTAAKLLMSGECLG